MGKRRENSASVRANCCCNPFSKPKHSSWRQFLKLRSVTSDIVEKLKACGLTALPVVGDKICTTCRVDVTSKYQQTIASREEAIDGTDLPEIESSESVAINNIDQLNEVLRLLGLDNVRVSEIRSKEKRLEMLKNTVLALKRLIGIDVDIFYEDTEVPIVKDLLKYYSEGSKPEKFKILTLFADRWSRNRMVDETGCSKYITVLVIPLFYMHTLQIIIAGKWIAGEAARVRCCKGILQLPDPSTSASEEERDAQRQAVEFYYESSTIMPGVRDKISIKTPTGRDVRQKRLLHGTLNELYAGFCETTQKKSLGFSTFAKLRPGECILAGGPGTHTVCVCMRHENVELCLRAIRSIPIIKSFSTEDLIRSHLVCQNPSAQCFLLECNQCPDLVSFTDKLLEEITNFPIEELKFKNWVQFEGHYQLVDCFKSPEEFVVEFGALLNDFLPHHFIARSQKEFIKNLKLSISPGEVIIHADFAENYKITIQNEIQSHHFIRKMVTIHPFVIYFRDGVELKHRTLIVVSPVMEHNFVLVHSCFEKLFNFLKEELPETRKAFILTDGAASQYKNKKNFTNISFMQEDFNVQVEWHFHASSHGKCPCDGVSGVIKRAAYKYSLSPTREELITDAASFYQWAIRYQSDRMSFAYVDQLEYENASKKLQDRVEGVQTIKGTHDLHCFIPRERYVLEVRKFSTSGEFILKNMKSKNSMH